MSLPESDRETLHKLALESIQYTLDNGKHARYESTLSLRDYSEALQQHRATFVTLHINHDLRGCIGTLEARQPLVIDVVENARSAAFHDPRFNPLSQSEYNKLEVHLSVLSVPEAMSFESEEDLINQIRPGIDGLVLTSGLNRGTFLPSVWESLTTTEEFWSHLKLKAGLPVNYWSDNVKVERYTTESF